MRKIFIDCGAHCGCSYRKFKKEFDVNNEYDVFSFEANPHLQKYYKSINKAVWTDNNKHIFYLRSPTSGGSTLKKEKTQYKPKGKKVDFEEVSVDCIDLNEFIKTLFNQDDYIILKMDIEGAEYDILPHLINGGSIQHINKLWIEWHNKKVLTDATIDEQLTKELESMGIEVKCWDAMQYCKKF